MGSEDDGELCWGQPPLSGGILETGEAEVAENLVTTRSTDPGDETERNFRYQHQYGVVLLAAVRRGTLAYLSIFCEHHEDFLCERPDGLFDGYQIKTSRPEGGAWTLTSQALVKSIGRFVELLAAYPGQVSCLFFVSNSEIDKVTAASSDDLKRSRCPGLMVEHVKGCTGPDDIQPPYRKAFDTLAAATGSDAAPLFDVLTRLGFVKGPSREEFDASLAQEHIGQLPDCAQLTPAELRDLCNVLVAQFHRAASLYVVDPDRHIHSVFDGSAVDPILVAKRIVCADVKLVGATTGLKPFSYPGESALKLDGSRPKGVLDQKLTRGGLVDVVAYMRAREDAAEYHFLEEQAKDPGTASRQLRQIEEAVHGECLEAFMCAKTPGQPFGEAMFNDVSARLRRLEQDRRQLLGGHPYEVLMGTAALLTSECRVWWSERFKLGGDRT